MLLVAALMLAGAILYKKQSSVPVPITTPAVATSNPPAPAAVTVKTPSPVLVKPSMTPEERELAIHQERERLAVLAMNNDSQSLSTILGDLTSPEKEIRLAAIEATKQYSSTNAIPVLKAIAEQTTDPEEVAALAEALEFLELPDADLVGNGAASGPAPAPAPVPPADTNLDLPPPQP